MRRLLSVFSAVFFAAAIVFSISVFTASEARSATPYSQVVDNTTKGRFTASGKWISSDYHSGTDYGKDYRVLKKPLPTLEAAQWKIKTPAKAAYNVYARWPADPGYTGRAVFRIKTPDGWKFRSVSQRVNGGKWIKLGTYKLAQGDSYRIQLSSRSSSEGFIIADAIKVARATSTDTDSGSDSGVTGSDIVREARRHIGKPYVYGASGPNSFDCSGFTSYVYSRLGINLPRTANDQYHSGPGRKVSSPRPGDLVFGNVDGSGIDHVGIVSGDRKMVHAGTPQTDVEETSWAGWYNVVGYKRIVPAG